MGESSGLRLIRGHNGRTLVRICGSGLIDAVSVANELGLINKQGKIITGDGKNIEIGDSGITLTQKDIRQLQMAKAAIRAGIDIMLEMRGIKAEDLAELYFVVVLDPILIRNQLQVLV